MQVNLDISFDPLALSDPDLLKVLNKTLSKLNAWVQKEAQKRASINLRLTGPKVLARRILKFKKTGFKKQKAWFGSNPIGADHFGAVHQTNAGVNAGGEFYKGAFVNHMDSDSPLVWRRETSARDSKLVRVTRDIDKDAEQIMNQLSLEINDKFVELLEIEINAIL